MLEIYDEEKIKHFLAIDLPNSYKGETNFTCELFRLVRKADSHNRYKLKTAFPNEIEAFDRFERIDMCEDWLELPTLGSIVKSGKPFLGVEPESLGVVLDVYRLNNNEEPDGVTILFSNGDIDGFSREDLRDLKIKHTGRIDEYLQYYCFNSVCVVQDEFSKGSFDWVFRGE